MARIHWHASRLTAGVTVALGHPVGLDTRQSAEAYVAADKAAHADSPNSHEWFHWPCVCDYGSEHWGRIDSVVWLNLNS